MDALLTADANKPSKRRLHLITRACTFCQRRHLKCDGKQPCTTCVTKEIADQCVFTQGAKRGRKSSKQDPQVEDTPAFNPSETFTPDTSVDVNLQEAITEAPPQIVVDPTVTFELQSAKHEAEYWKQQYFREHEKLMKMQFDNRSDATSLLQMQRAPTHLQPLPARDKFKVIPLEHVKDNKHLEYMKLFLERLQPLVPFVNPCFGKDFNFNQWASLQVDEYEGGKAQIMCEAFEYAVICSLGALEVNLQESQRLMKIAEKLMFMLLFVDTAHTDQFLACKIVRQLIMMVWYYWTTTSHAKTKLCANLAHSIWAQNKAAIPPMETARVFGILASTATDLKDREYWLDQLGSIWGKFEPVQNTTCMQIAFVSSFFLKTDKPNANDSTSVLNKMLVLLEDIEGRIPSEPSRPFPDQHQLILWGCKARVLYEMGLVMQALSYAQQVLFHFKQRPRSNMGVLLAMGFSLQISKAFLQPEAFQEQVSLFDAHKAKYPLLMRISKILRDQITPSDKGVDSDTITPISSDNQPIDLPQVEGIDWDQLLSSVTGNEVVV